MHSRAAVTSISLVLSSLGMARAAVAAPENNSPNSTTQFAAKPKRLFEAPPGYAWPSLMVGDAAPRLSVDRWLQGKALEAWGSESQSASLSLIHI